MRVRYVYGLTIAIVVSLANAGFGDVVIGDFEQTAPGWGRWSGGVQPWDANYSYSLDGNTLNDYSVQYTKAGGGWAQSLAYSAGTAGTIADFVAHDKFMVDVTFPATTFDGWAQIFDIALNSQYGGFVGASYTAQGVGWGPGGGGAQTVTLTYDYSSGATDHKTDWLNNGTPGWVEVDFRHQQRCEPRCLPVRQRAARAQRAGADVARTDGSGPCRTAHRSAAPSGQLRDKLMGDGFDAPERNVPERRPIQNRTD